MYKKESLETLRQQVDLVDVISSHIEMKRSGASFVGLCPFHDEKTPSFMIQRGDRHYHCFGCGAHGDAIQFLVEHVKLSFSDAVEALAERFHVKLEKIEGKEGDGPSRGELKRALELASMFYQFHLHHTPEGKEALDYLKGRGIDLSFTLRFELGWAPKAGGMLKKWLQHHKVPGEVCQAAGLLNNGFKDFFSARIQFPIKDASGQVIGFSGRKIHEETFGGKYVNTPETPLFKKSKVLFGIEYSRKRIAKEQRALIVEGQMDCLRLIDAGFNFTVAGQGTAFGEGQVHELIHLGTQEVFLALDSDSAGQEAAVKIGHLFQKAGVGVRVLELPKGDDPDSFVRREGAQAFLSRLGESGGYLPFLVRMESKSYDMKTPAGKAALARALCDRIKTWNEEVMILESLRWLSGHLQIPEEMLGIGERHRTHPLIQKNGILGQVNINPDRILEGEFLRWLIYGGQQKYLETAKAHLVPADFFSPTCREIFEARGAGNLSSLSGEAQALLNELGSKKVAAETHFEALLQKILDRNWLRRREEIKIQIQSNQYSEDEVLKLAKEFTLLTNAPPRIKIDETSRAL